MECEPPQGSADGVISGSCPASGTAIIHDRKHGRVVSMEDAADPRQREIPAALIDRAHAGMPRLHQPALPAHTDDVVPANTGKILEHGGNDLLDRRSAAAVLIRRTVISAAKQNSGLGEQPRSRIGEIGFQSRNPPSFRFVVGSKVDQLSFEFFDARRSAHRFARASQPLPYGAIVSRLPCQFRILRHCSRTPFPVLPAAAVPPQPRLDFTNDIYNVVLST